MIANTSVASLRRLPTSPESSAHITGIRIQVRVYVAKGCARGIRDGHTVNDQVGRNFVCLLLQRRGGGGQIAPAIVVAIASVACSRVV